jgi:hypothetical protein
MGQLKIVRMLFIESQFTPSQAVRVFPVIESAETFGIIFGGLLISIFATTLSFDKFVYIWILALLLIVPVVSMFAPKSVYLQLESMHILKKKGSLTLNYSLRSVLGKISGFMKNKTILGLILIVLCQWIFFTIIEYEYTKSVEYMSHAVQLQMEDMLYKSGFAEDLGRLQVLIGSSALLFQLVLASRLLNFMGIVGSLLLYPIVLFVGIFSYLFNPGFSSLLIARFGHEMTNVLHYNAYHTSYYAFDHAERSSLMEFIEGIVRPLGAVIATLAIFAIEYFVVVSFQSVAFSILMIMLLALLLLFTVNFKFEFDELPKNDLMNSSSVVKLIDALNLMRENFHPGDSKFLVNLLINRKDLPDEVVEHIFVLVSEFGDLDDLSFLIDEFENSRFDRLMILDCIQSIVSRFGDELTTKPFTFHGLNTLLNSSKSNIDSNLYVKINSIKLSLSVADNSLHKFLSDSLGEHADNLLISSHNTLSQVNDSHVMNILKEYLSSANPYVKTGTLYVVRKFIDASFAKNMVKKCLTSSSLEEVEAILLYILKAKEFKEYASSTAQIKEKFYSNKNVCLLIDMILFLNKNAINKLHLLFERTSLDSLAWIYTKLDYIENPVIDKLFVACVESRIHTCLSSLIESEGDVKDIMQDLKVLFGLLDSKKDYFIVQELFS